MENAQPELPLQNALEDVLASARAGKVSQEDFLRLLVGTQVLI